MLLSARTFSEGRTASTNNPTPRNAASTRSDLGDLLETWSHFNARLTSGCPYLLVALFLLGVVGPAVQLPALGRHANVTGLALACLPLVLFVLVLGALIAAAAWSFSRLSDTHLFYQRGVELRRRNRVIATLRYDQAEGLAFGCRRKYGKRRRYRGTLLYMNWWNNGSLLMGFSASYAESVPGASPLDRVRDVAAAALTPRFVAALSQGKAFELANGHVANGAGISFARVFRKSLSAAYADIASMEFNDFELVVHLRSGERFTCVTSVENFWPKFQAVQAFWLAACQARNCECVPHVHHS